MKMILFACTWALADFLALQLPVLANNNVVVIILVLLLTATAFIRTRLTKLTCLLWIFAISFVFSTAIAKQAINQWLPHQFENIPLSVEVVIEDIIKQPTHHYLIIADIKKDNWQGRASIYINEKFFLKNQFQVGQQWRMTIKLKRPHGFANPYLMRNEIFYLESRIQALGTLQEKSPVVLLAYHHHFWKTVRHNIQDKIFSILNHSTEASFISALTLGHLQNFDINQKQVLQKTGTSHLLAISGLHIGLVAMAAHVIAKIIGKQFVNVMLYLPLPKFAAIFSLMSALLYSLLSGFSLPTQRAFMMITVILLARCFSRSIPKWHGFSWALFLVLLFDPLAIINSSFWLSFVAVVTIFLMSDHLNKENKWWSLLQWQILLSISLLPWTLYFFQGFSLVSIPANLIAIPWVGYVVIPLSLLGVIFLNVHTAIAKILFLGASYNLKLLLNGLEILSKFDWAQWQASHISFVIFFTSALSCLLICYQALGLKRFFAIIGLLPLFYLSSIHPKQNQLFLYILDVGQGLAIVIQTEKHLLLYDAGLKIQHGFDAGKMIITPFLKQLGVKKIDRVVISHADNDHSGGIKSVSENFVIKELLSSEHKNFVSNTETRWCFSGEHWNWDGVEFEFLHPNLSFLKDENDGSCVLKITQRDISILLPGDIESDAEHFLVQNFPRKLPSNILIAPHHGSRTSSTIDFSNAVQPQYVIISSGYLNRFHFPNMDVVARYKNMNATVFNTAEVGAVTIKIDNNKISEVSAERIQHKKFWDQ